MATTYDDDARGGRDEFLAELDELIELDSRADELSTKDFAACTVDELLASHRRFVDQVRAREAKLREQEQREVAAIVCPRCGGRVRVTYEPTTYHVCDHVFDALKRNATTVASSCASPIGSVRIERRPCINLTRLDYPVSEAFEFRVRQR